jgi:chromate transporter
MSERRTSWEVFKVSTRLGVTSFGGPIAHLGYFHSEYVERKKWLDEKNYADIVSLCQFLPGPASSQVGIAIGITQAGMLGGIAAWLGFTLPSAVLLVLFAYLVKGFDVSDAVWLHGLMIVSVTVVAQAVWTMARNLASDRTRGTIAILSAITCILFPVAWIQVAVIALAGGFGRLFLYQPSAEARSVSLQVPISRQTALTAWTLFFLLLFGLPLLLIGVHNHALAVFDSFYRTGSLVFGGGHVVLPLLQSEIVANGWVTNAQFLAGYGAAQAVPGPLFTFAAYLGAVMRSAPNGWLGACLSLVAIFLPSFLLVVGSLPFLSAIQGRPGFQSALRGVNAAVVGILLAALYHPVWTSAIRTPHDFCLALAAFLLLMIWKLPPWVVVLFGVAGSVGMSIW